MSSDWSSNAVTGILQSARAAAGMNPSVQDCGAVAQMARDSAMSCMSVAERMSRLASGTRGHVDKFEQSKQLMLAIGKALSADASRSTELGDLQALAAEMLSTFEQLLPMLDGGMK